MKTFEFYLDAVKFCRQTRLPLSSISKLSFKSWGVQHG